MSELAKRLLTGGALALLVLFLIFKSPTGFVLLMVAVAAIGVYEFLKLIQTSTGNKLIAIAVLALSSYFIIITPTIVDDDSFANMIYIAVLSIVCLWWLNNFWMIAHYPNSKPATMFTPLKPALLFLPLFLLSLLESNLILLLFLIVWGADSFAYFSGRAFGKRKLAPNLSGGKTIEGVVGGLISVLLIAGVWMFSYNESNWLFLLLALITGIFSVMGDLYESIYKREAGVKDSGNILPGHGGVFDRIDGLLAATPVFIMGAQLL